MEVMLLAGSGAFVMDPTLGTMQQTALEYDAKTAAIKPVCFKISKCYGHE